MIGYIFGAYFKQFSLSFPDVNKAVADSPFNLKVYICISKFSSLMCLQSAPAPFVSTSRQDAAPTILYHCSTAEAQVLYQTMSELISEKNENI